MKLDLDDREAVLYHLRDMSAAQRRAHEAAGEDGGRTGVVRDLLFGIGTVLDALVQMIEEGEG